MRNSKAISARTSPKPFVGGIAGLITLNIGGLVLGLFVGAVIPEVILGGRSPKGALRIDWGGLLGFLGGTLMKFILGLVMIGIFLFALRRAFHRTFKG